MASTTITVPNGHTERKTANSPGVYEIYVQHGARLDLHVGLEKGSVSIDLFLQGAFASAYVTGLYVVRGYDQFTCTIIQHHQAAFTTCTVLVKGLVCDEAKSSYRGAICVESGAKNAFATHYNKNLVIGPKARSISIPSMEVSVDCVTCKHGSASASFDNDHIVYMESRGIASESAKRMLLLAFFDDVLDFCAVSKKQWQDIIMSVRL